MQNDEAQSTASLTDFMLRTCYHTLGGMAMGPLMKDIGISLLMGLILPGILLNTADYLLNNQQIMPQAQEATSQLQAESEDMLLRLSDGRRMEMELETYLVGVVLAEMPASFDPEALKAQAVAARTYTCKAGITGGKHGDGAVCTKASCCQAYLTEEEYLGEGGSQEGIDKIRSAIMSTIGCVLTYDEELIEATYFSCSGGATEDALAVWGTDYPYLRSVPSPGEEDAAYTADTAVFTCREFQNALGRILQGEPYTWFGPVTYTKGGGVAQMVIGGESYTGTQLRSILKLRSTNFTVSVVGEDIVITTHGYGHRVGMSQYGADAMAAAGSTWEEILAHYYPGTEVIRLENRCADRK